MNNFTNFDRDLKRTNKLIGCGFVFSSLAAIAIAIGIISLSIITIVGHISEYGLKNVLQNIWEGNQNIENIETPEQLEQLEHLEI